MIGHHDPFRSKLYGLASILVSLLFWGLYVYLRRLFLRRRPLSAAVTGNMALPNIDLVVVFKAASTSLVKAKIRADAKESEEQYTRLLDTLKSGGLHATGRRGASQGQVIVLISCPQEQIAGLVQRDRYAHY
jgi:hypothetical protein